MNLTTFWCSCLYELCWLTYTSFTWKKYIAIKTYSKLIMLHKKHICTFWQIPLPWLFFPYHTLLLVSLKIKQKLHFQLKVTIFGRGNRLKFYQWWIIICTSQWFLFFFFFFPERREGRNEIVNKFLRCNWSSKMGNKSSSKG